MIKQRGEQDQNVINGQPDFASRISHLGRRTVEKAQDKVRGRTLFVAAGLATLAMAPKSVALALAPSYVGESVPMLGSVKTSQKNRTEYVHDGKTYKHSSKLFGLAQLFEAETASYHKQDHNRYLRVSYNESIDNPGNKLFVGLDDIKVAPNSRQSITSLTVDETRYFNPSTGILTSKKQKTYRYPDTDFGRKRSYANPTFPLVPGEEENIQIVTMIRGKNSSQTLPVTQADSLRITVNGHPIGGGFTGQISSNMLETTRITTQG
jgi:hypothetical protein